MVADQPIANGFSGVYSPSSSTHGAPATLALRIALPIIIVLIALGGVVGIYFSVKRSSRSRRAAEVGMNEEQAVELPMAPPPVYVQGGMLPVYEKESRTPGTSETSGA